MSIASRVPPLLWRYPPGDGAEPGDAAELAAKVVHRNCRDAKAKGNAQHVKRDPRSTALGEAAAWAAKASHCPLKGRPSTISRRRRDGHRGLAHVKSK